MEVESLFYFIVLALFAEILGTIGGFGSSLFFVPIAAYFLDFHSVLGVTALFHVSSNISKIVLFKKGFDKRLIIYLGVPAVTFVIIGAFLSRFISTQLLEISLAAFLIMISVVLLVFNNLSLKPSTTNAVGGGIISGFVAGLLGTGGAIRGIVLAAFNLKMDVFIATSAIIDLGIDASRSIVYAMNGYIHKHDLYLIPILILTGLAGTWLGKKILTKVSEKQFKSFVLILVLIAGIATLVKYINR